jgi:branched-chain amino acid transport system substrate-binding protein
MLWLIAAALVASCSADSADTPDSTPTSAAGPSGDTTIVRKGEKLRIGVSTALTTEQAEFGVPISNAAKLAAAERRSIHGFELELLVEDDVCTGPGAEAVAQRLIAVNAAAVVGPMCASGVVAALDDYGDARLPVISSSASHGSVTEQTSENFVRTIWNDDTEGEEIAKYAVNVLGLRRVAIIDDGGPRGSSVIDAAEASLRALGAEVLVRDHVEAGAAFGESVANIVAASPEIVIFGGSADTGAPLAAELRRVGFVGTVLGAASETTDAPWIEVENAYVSRGPTATDSRYDALLNAYRATYGDQAGTSYIEYTYDAMLIVFDAIERVGVVDGGGNLTISRQGLIDALKTARLENGASGTVAFKANGDRDIAAGAVNAIFQVRDGMFVRVQ